MKSNVPTKNPNKCPECGDENWYYNHDEENECRSCGYVQNEYVGSGTPNSVEKRLEERYITILLTWNIPTPETVCNDLIMAHRRICGEVEELGEPKSVAVGAGHDAYCTLPHCGGVLRNYNGIYCYDCGQEYVPKSLIDYHGDEEKNCLECDGTGRRFGVYCEACNATGIRFAEKQGESELSNCCNADIEQEALHPHKVYCSECGKEHVDVSSLIGPPKSAFPVDEGDLKYECRRCPKFCRITCQIGVADPLTKCPTGAFSPDWRLKED